ncbi:hypothetical protein NDU88_005076 [Pleurodeles waltl]|uniref:Uncharacterized protein n=1 Tax=Pleurodeles waltl TaxID=8319 RepID=A0AAV7VLQ9_PLEWA|nr:hypothetical protein NDU88_005076 [Pleurodeles waltl]
MPSFFGPNQQVPTLPLQSGSNEPPARPALYFLMPPLRNKLCAPALRAQAAPLRRPNDGQEQRPGKRGNYARSTLKSYIYQGLSSEALMDQTRNINMYIIWACFWVRRGV